MQPKVRFFEHSDADGVVGIYQKFGTWFEDIGVNREFILSSAARPDFRFLVAEVDGTLLGFIGCLYQTAVGRAELGPLGVDEAYQGYGIGSALREAMFRFLKENGIRRVFVKVKANNSKAVNFFLKEGFNYEAYLRGYTMEGEDVVQMNANV
ncbi:MAG: GNAT family N-acetyltransferase [Candidatus Altiarchaeota archaeon]